MELLLIGGARFSGRALTGLALEHGHDVTLFHRGSGPDDPWPAAAHVHGDREDGFGDLAGRRFDAIVDTCGFVPRTLAESAAAFPDAGRYLFVSSLSAHRDDAGLGAAEDDAVHAPPFPQTEEITEETYGPLKVASEEVVRERYGERATIVRPGFIVGPWDPTDRFTYWLVRPTRGGEMLAAGPPSYAMQWVDGRDLAAFVLHLCEEQTPGTVSVVTRPGEGTIEDVVATARDQAGADTTFTWIDEAFASEQGLTEDPADPLPMWVPSMPGFHAFDPSRAFEAGLRTRPLAETVADTLAWHAERGSPWPLKAGLSDEREAELLAAWHTQH
ncbi:MAG: NAD-dependent epimerase/dehydratase family protein [Actinomycetota bacterium]